MLCKRHVLFLHGLALVLLLGGCASLPSDVARPPSHVLKDTSATRLGRVVEPLAARHPGKSGFYALADGVEAFALRLALVNRAQKSLDVQYYIWHNDLTGKALMNMLIHAADRGVRVRLLLDDLDTKGKEEILRIIDSHPHIEIRLFNPFASRGMRFGDYLTDTSRINRRMHNKSLTADNQATIFGGRNIGDEYFDATEEVGFSDMDVLAVGPVVTEVSQAFDLYWNSAWVYPLAAFYQDTQVDPDEIKAAEKTAQAFIETAKSSPYADALRGLDIARLPDIAALPYEWSQWKLIYDQPSKVEAKVVRKETHLAPALKEAMDKINSEMLIVSPYFVPGERFTDYLVGLVKDGKQIHVMTNSLAASDVSVVYAGYLPYRIPLVKGGVDLYEFKAVKQEADAPNHAEQATKTKAKWAGSSRASLHAKFICFDRRFLFIGSFNLDARSVALNTELGVFFESPVYGKQVAETFSRQAMQKGYRLEMAAEDELKWVTRTGGKQQEFEVEPDTGFWKRFGAYFMSIFVPESQL